MGRAASERGCAVLPTAERWRRAGGQASGEQQVRAAAPYRSPLRGSGCAAGGAGRVGGRAASSRWRREGGRRSARAASGRCAPLGRAAHR
eukprot:jgi/Tetstr1/457948/TSEL_044461.t1